MKLATLKEGGRDGTLVVVDRLLRRAVRVPTVSPTLQRALDNWPQTEAELGHIYDRLNSGSEPPGTFALESTMLAAPLPRAYQWLDGSAYVNHVELVRKARGASMPENFWTDPLMYQGGSDNFTGPRDPISIASTEWGIDFESEVTVITDDVPMGTGPVEATHHIKLLMLVNDVSLRNLIPGELAKNFGFLHGKPACSFSPVAVTPDELGGAWRDQKVHLPLVTRLNGERFGAPEAGEDMTFNFSTLIAHAAKTRHLGAGTIVGSGTVSNRDRSRGSSCIVEKRMLEILAGGEATTPFLSFGDRVQIEMFDNQGVTIFGAIDQQVERYRAPGH